MAQLAAQEYFTRLHTTPNLAAQMPFGRADLAAMLNPAAMGLTGDLSEQQKNAMADAYRVSLSPFPVLQKHWEGNFHLCDYFLQAGRYLSHPGQELWDECSNECREE